MTYGFWIFPRKIQTRKPNSLNVCFQNKQLKLSCQYDDDDVFVLYLKATVFDRSHRCIPIWKARFTWYIKYSCIHQTSSYHIAMYYYEDISLGDLEKCQIAAKLCYAFFILFCDQRKPVQYWGRGINCSHVALFQISYWYSISSHKSWTFPSAGLAAARKCNFIFLVSVLLGNLYAIYCNLYCQIEEVPCSTLLSTCLFPPSCLCSLVSTTHVT